MLRAVAAFLLACQALPYSAVLVCTGHRTAEAACDQMAGGGMPAATAGLHHESPAAPHAQACPIAQLCTSATTLSLPTLAAGASQPTAIRSLAVAPTRQAHAADAIAPPLHPPKA